MKFGTEASIFGSKNTCENYLYRLYISCICHGMPNNSFYSLNTILCCLFYITKVNLFQLDLNPFCPSRVSKRRPPKLSYYFLVFFFLVYLLLCISITSNTTAFECSALSLLLPLKYLRLYLFNISIAYFRTKARVAPSVNGFCPGIAWKGSNAVVWVLHTFTHTQQIKNFLKSCTFFRRRELCEMSKDQTRCTQIRVAVEQNQLARKGCCHMAGGRES